MVHHVLLIVIVVLGRLNFTVFSLFDVTVLWVCLLFTAIVFTSLFSVNLDKTYQKHCVLASDAKCH